MTPEIAVLLAILASALVLLASERLSSDLVALLVLVALLLTGSITPQQAVGGFGHPAVLTIAAVLVLGAGLEETGAVRALAAWCVRRGRGATGLVLAVMLSAAVIAAFVGGMLVVAALLPIVLAASAARGRSASAILLPLAFAIQIGGACTLIGSSTNLLVSSIAERAGLAPLGMFELTPLGLFLLGTAAVYFVVAGRRLLPGRRGGALDADFRLGEYVAEMRVPPRSELAGRTVREARLIESHGVRVLDLLRGGRRIWFPERETIEAGDHVLVRGDVGDLMRLESEGRLELVPGAVLAERLRSGERALVEALVAPRSRLIGRTLHGIYFRHRYHAAVLAMRRGGRALHEALTSVPLELGDSLLLYGPPEEIERLRSDDDFLVLQEPTEPRTRPRRALLAGLVLAAVVTLVTLDVVPVLVAALLGLLALALTRSLSLDVAYRAIDWSVIVVLGALLPLAAALEQRGALAWIADHSVTWLGHPLALLALVYLATVALSELAGSDVATVLLAPLAIALAQRAGVDPRPFLVAVAFAAAASFATPRGHPANALVYSAGGYRRLDLVRVGLPLNALFLGVTLLVIPRLWPF